MGSHSQPWDPNASSFPLRKDLPAIPGAPKDASWFWGKDDNLGRINLLTPSRVKAASSEIRTGEIVPINLSLNHPETPAFDRAAFKHSIKALNPGKAYDDMYVMNTQSGTQWDGFRHFSHHPSSTFYNGTKGSDIDGPNPNDKCSIHHWSEHGIAGRGILLDFWSYAQANGINFDPYTTYRISYSDLVATGKAQGIDIRPQSQGGDIQIGDIIMVRSGFIQAYLGKSTEERYKMATRPHEMGPTDQQMYVGLEQDEQMLDWLHDSYVTAVAGDQPSLEAWPSNKDYWMHEYLLARWGMPMGELWDLEKLSEACRRVGKWSFFFTSSPANVPGGVASHVNGLAIL